MNSSRTLAAAAVTSSLLLALPLASSASAASGEVRASGSCSGVSHWKLKAKPDNGRLEVEGEVDSTKNGQTWTWRILHNGSTSASGSASTSGASHSFSVTRRVTNLAGTDTIGWRATRSNGETCSGSLKI